MEQDPKVLRAKQEEAFERYFANEGQPEAGEQVAEAAPGSVAVPVDVDRLLAIYRHLLGTIGWALFWFGFFGGGAAVVVYALLENRLDLPLLIVTTVCWGAFGAMLAFASRSDLTKLTRRLR